MAPFHLSCALAAGLLLGTIAPATAQSVIMAPGAQAPSDEDPYLFHVYGARPGEAVNIRSGAGTRFRVIGTLADGAPVEKQSCREDSRGYWCRISTTDRPRISGWVVGRALHQDEVPHDKAPSTDDYVAEGAYDAIGSSRCRADGSRPRDGCE